MGLDMNLMVASGIETVTEGDGYQNWTYTRLKDSTEIAYWRKANAIHNWFVKNVQNGVDDCGTYEVTPKQLENLRETIGQALDGPESAQHYLPPTSGFFFGPTGIDDYYWHCMQVALEAIEDALAVQAPYKVYYTSSW
jgi:hypothetical protein